MFEYIVILGVLIFILGVILKFNINFGHSNIQLNGLYYYPDGTLIDDIDKDKFPMFINEYLINIENGEIVVYKCKCDGYKKITNITQSMNLLKQFGV